ncbi:hypothetical protein BZA05DRAFT_415203 [Tricharina praecox]|uniref:uncharacterized protein n=1 Tax=Tricharina praecox TaxID=43433 RepID=UPI0022210B51|nr:uncharacterized protein BZA05DRAFT_415203 [Tricharina praecox]KAI5857811.1 hypothetical protein BZA05DRAFT_415203 [Tricharina praecox]
MSVFRGVDTEPLRRVVEALRRMSPTSTPLEANPSPSVCSFISGQDYLQNRFKYVTMKSELQERIDCLEAKNGAYENQIETLLGELKRCENAKSALMQAELKDIHEKYHQNFRQIVNKLVNDLDAERKNMNALQKSLTEWQNIANGMKKLHDTLKVKHQQLLNSTKEEKLLTQQHNPEHSSQIRELQIKVHNLQTDISKLKAQEKNQKYKFGELTARILTLQIEKSRLAEINALSELNEAILQERNDAEERNTAFRQQIEQLKRELDNSQNSSERDLGHEKSTDSVPRPQCSSDDSLQAELDRILPEQKIYARNNGSEHDRDNDEPRAVLPSVPPAASREIKYAVNAHNREEPNALTNESEGNEGEDECDNPEGSENLESEPTKSELEELEGHEEELKVANDARWNNMLRHLNRYFVTTVIPIDEADLHPVNTPPEPCLEFMECMEDTDSLAPSDSLSQYPGWIPFSDETAPDKFELIREIKFISVPENVFDIRNVFKGISCGVVESITYSRRRREIVILFVDPICAREQYIRLFNRPLWLPVADGHLKTSLNWDYFHCPISPSPFKWTRNSEPVSEELRNAVYQNGVSRAVYLSGDLSGLSVAKVMEDALYQIMSHTGTTRYRAWDIFEVVEFVEETRQYRILCAAILFACYAKEGLSSHPDYQGIEVGFGLDPCDRHQILDELRNHVDLTPGELVAKFGTALSPDDSDWPWALPSMREKQSAKYWAWKQAKLIRGIQPTPISAQRLADVVNSTTLPSSDEDIVAEENDHRGGMV